ncbi:uncharacterized protein LOC134203312 isoform X3 [Armigeres subalbatus]|uniref:uncharacterized protein LOC134203312 isoform X3 n=1 Tax=Armigeres subalbatus TaxID=124917 RepID=UPI002ED699CE
MNRKELIYVENISPTSSEQNLQVYLEKFAPVQAVYFLREKQCTKRSIAAFLRVANETDRDIIMLRNQQNYRGKRLFMLQADRPHDYQADHTVIVRNITTKISEENLFEHFEDCGKIAFLQIRTDDFAYVAFEDKTSVRNAVNKNNQPLKGSNLKIQLLTRNLDIMIVNLDTLCSRMPDLYRKLVLPLEPRASNGQQQQPVGQTQPTAVEQQSKSQPTQQQQQSQKSRQQQEQQQRENQQRENQQRENQQRQQQIQRENQQRQQQLQRENQQRQQQQRENQQRQQQQQAQQQRLQQQQQLLQQQKPLPQRQQNQRQLQNQQQQLQQQIQMLKDKANALAEKQQQQKQAPAQQPPKSEPVVIEEEPPKKQNETETNLNTSDTDDVQIVEVMETQEIIEDDDDDTDVQIVEKPLVDPIPSEYQRKPDDVMRPLKASEVVMKDVLNLKGEDDRRAVWVNNIQPETRRLDLVMYLEQFGDVMHCKVGNSKNCAFTRWAKVLFSSEDAAARAAEYFVHPFQGRYLFVLHCTKFVVEEPGKVFAIDFLSKYLVYEDVAKAFKHIGEVFYMVRLYDNNYKVRIFFVNAVDEQKVLAVGSIGSHPIKLELYVENMQLRLQKTVANELRAAREIMDAAMEARKAKINAIYKQEALDRCDPREYTNPDPKTSPFEVIIYNVPVGTTDQQIKRYFKSIGEPTAIRRETMHTETHEVREVESVYVGFSRLSMAMQAAEIPPEKKLNSFNPFIFLATTQAAMNDGNTLRLFFNNFITIQDIYNGLIHCGPIKYIEKQRAKRALIMFGNGETGITDAKKMNFIGNVKITVKETPPSKVNPQYTSEDNANPATDECAQDPQEPTNLRPHTIGTWNVMGGATERVDRFLHSQEVDVACLQETQIPTNTFRTEHYIWFNVHKIGASIGTKGGTAIAVCNDLAEQCKFKQWSDNICWVKVPIYGKLVIVISVYAHTAGVDGLLPDPEFKSLSTILSGLGARSRANLIIMGDFQAQIGFQDMPSRLQSFIGNHLYHPFSNANGEGLKLILQEFDLRLCSSFGPCESVTCTWQKGDQQAQTSHIIMPIIDRFLRPKCRCVDCDPRLSEHRMLLLTVRHRILNDNSVKKAPVAKKRTASASLQRQEKPWRENKPWFDEECQQLREATNYARRKATRVHSEINQQLFLEARSEMNRVYREKKLRYEESGECTFQATRFGMNDHRKQNDAGKNQPAIVIDDEDDVVVVPSNESPNKKNQKGKNQPKGGPTKKQPQKQHQQNKQHPQQGSGGNRNRRSNQSFGDGQQQFHMDQQRFPDNNPWQNNQQDPVWQDQFNQRQRNQNQFMPNDRFNPNGPFDRFGNQEPNMNMNMNQFEQMMMAQQFDNFNFGNNDNNFNRGNPMDTDDPPLERNWGQQQHHMQQQQHFNRFSPPRHQSQFNRGFSDERDDFGRDSPGIPPNIPEDEIDNYIVQKQEAIKRRLEQLDRQLIDSVETSRHRDFENSTRRRQGTVFSDNGDVHYVPNPAAVARNRGGRRGGRGGRGDPGANNNQEANRNRGRGRRDREENFRNRTRDPFADVDIVPIIRISEDGSPSPKRSREDEFDTAQFDAAWI